MSHKEIFKRKARSGTVNLKTSVEVFRPHSGRPLGGIHLVGPGAHSAGPSARCAGKSCRNNSVCLICLWKPLPTAGFQVKTIISFCREVIYSAALPVTGSATLYFAGKKGSPAAVKAPLLS